MLIKSFFSYKTYFRQKPAFFLEKKHKNRKNFTKNHVIRMINVLKRELLNMQIMRKPYYTF